MDRDSDTERPANEPKPTKPAEVIRDSNLKATLWRNESEKGPYYATEFSRTYTDGDGKPRDSRSFVGSDLLRLSELARKAYDRTNEMRREEFKEQRREQEPRRDERARTAPERGR